MKKMKKAALIFGTGLCLAVGTGGTLAYLGDTGQVANRLTFAGEKGLDAVLTEPSWNPQKGLLTVPGSSVAKDPQITNTSELNMNELAALKCEFVYSQNCPDKSKRGKVLSAQDMEKVVQVYTIDYNSDDAAKGEWVRFAEQKKTDPVQYFYYSKVLKRNLNGTGETTVPLFTKVWVDKKVNNRRQTWIQEMGGVEIKISGQILQQMTGEEYFGLKYSQDTGKKNKERKRKYENEQRKKKCIICGSTFMCYVIWNWKHNGLFHGKFCADQCFYHRGP